MPFGSLEPARRLVWVVVAACCVGAPVTSNADTTPTPLHAAARAGDLARVKALLDGGTPVDLRAPDTGETVLHAAVDAGHRDVVRHLVARGADVNARTRHGATPLLGALLSDDDELVAVLLDAKADPNGGDPLHVAALTGASSAARLLLRAGADVNRMVDDVTPLLLASGQGHAAVVRVLLDAGSNPRHASPGMTPLHAVARGSSGGMLLMEAALRPYGASLTPEMKRRLQEGTGRAEITRLLVAAGADVEARTPQRWKPLITAAWNGRIEVVEALLPVGADISARDSEGFTRPRRHRPGSSPARGPGGRGDQ